MPGVPGTSQPQRGTARSKPTPGPRDATRHCSFEVSEGSETTHIDQPAIANAALLSPIARHPDKVCDKGQPSIQLDIEPPNLCLRRKWPLESIKEFRRDR
jgi:hypothetical protein